MSVDTFKTDVIVSNGECHNVFNVRLTDIVQHASYKPNIFVDQDQFSYPDFISGLNQRENVEFTDIPIYQ